jgi:VanZ family protein
VNLPAKRLAAASWLAVAVYAGIIFYLSTQSNPLPALAAQVSDKILHLTEYGGLGLLLGIALAQRPDFGWRDILFWTALAGLLYGGSDEIHQSYVPGRDCEVGDMLADTLGCFLGGAASLWAARRVLLKLVGPPPA